MKKSILTKLFAFGLLAVVFTACNKYEEGSNFSLISAKARVANIWKVKSITANGTDITSLNTVTQIEATKDGNYNVTYTVLGVSTTDEGTWAFNDDKTEIITTDSNGDATSATIVKLKKDEMKTSRTDTGITYVTELETK
jgi:hypothetical protein